jgi:hypothetical protein
VAAVTDVDAAAPASNGKAEEAILTPGAPEILGSQQRDGTGRHLEPDVPCARLGPAHDRRVHGSHIRAMPSTPPASAGAHTDPAEPARQSTSMSLRRLLAGILLLGLVGTGAELLLLEHTEDPWQLVPVALIGMATALVAWVALRPWGPGRAAVRALRGLMGLFVAAGAVGVVLHYRGNVEFEREREPELGGLGLFSAAMTGATPALAPGVMIQLGLLGLAYAHRHPALARSRADDSNDESAR